MENNKKRKIITISLICAIVALLALIISLIVARVIQLQNAPAPVPTPTGPMPTEQINEPSMIEVREKGKTEPLDSIEIIEGNTIELEAYCDKEINGLSYTFEIDEPTIAIMEGSILKALSAGQAFLSVSCNEYSSLAIDIIINVKDRVAQKGVGDGTSPESPIFIGNEGSLEPLEIYYIEVSKTYADAVYIKKGLFDILIDAGTAEDGMHVKEFVESHMEDKTLDLVMVSHAHDDHYGGVSKVLEAVDNVSLFLDYGGDSQNSYTEARDAFVARGSKHFGAYDCANELNDAVKKWYLTKDLTCEILNTGNYIKQNGSAQNPQSVAAIFEYKDFSYFTAGDLTTSAETDLLKYEELQPVSLYKASHHGSHGSNSIELLNALDPYCIGISAAITGDPNGQNDGIKGHPAGAAVQRFFQAPRISRSHNVYWNGVNGDMCFTTYGGATDISFKGSPTRKGYYYQDELGNKVKAVGEENKKFSETILFKLRGYEEYLIA